MIETPQPIREIGVLYAIVGVNPPGDAAALQIFESHVHDMPYEGIAAMQIPGLGFIPLVCSGDGPIERAVDKMRLMIAKMQADPEFDGRELRIVRFARVEIVP